MTLKLKNPPSLGTTVPQLIVGSEHNTDCICKEGDVMMPLRMQHACSALVQELDPLVHAWVSAVLAAA